jgi:(1->4)-alpha-D-glucan 1-alpha-D-glucosylmutase
VREAKTHTSWINPDARYEEALSGFAAAIVDAARSAAFLDDFVAFQARVAHFGAINSLAQTLVKITAPGVPDFYQGTELWDLSLVDPDNRRPVDWALRRQRLGELNDALAGAGDRAHLAEELFKHKDDGRVKLYVIREALALRRARAALFASGAYRPLETRGALAERVCAFARADDGHAVLTVVPRLLAGVAGEASSPGAELWRDTTLDVPSNLGRHFVNVLTGEPVTVGPSDGPGGVPLAELFAHLPVALLATEAA